MSCASEKLTYKHSRPCQSCCAAPPRALASSSCRPGYSCRRLAPSREGRVAGRHRRCPSPLEPFCRVTPLLSRMCRMWSHKPENECQSTAFARSSRCNSLRQTIQATRSSWKHTQTYSVQSKTKAKGKVRFKPPSHELRVALRLLPASSHEEAGGVIAARRQT
jgi:hypothetical protein